MKRTRMYLCAYFPEWAIDVTKRKITARGTEPNTQITLLTSTLANQVVVSRCCSRAARAGVRPMMALPIAEAFAPGSIVEPFDPLRDYRALYMLAVWCLRFSPCVGLDSELVNARKHGKLATTSALHYGIMMDLTGMERIHGDYARFGEYLSALFKQRARIAIAPTIGGAWALSRYGNNITCTALSIPALLETLSLLPTRALRIDLSCVELLADIGVRTIGELLSLPRHTLGQRFGKPLVYRLHQALGTLEERLSTVDSPERCERHRIFEPPLTHRRAIVIAIEHLFKELLNELRAKQMAANYFCLTIYDTSSQRARKEFPLTSATNDGAHLLSILEPIIDSMRFDGEAREIRLRARHLERAAIEQRSFTSRHTDPTDIAQSYKELLNAFSVRIGKNRVSMAKLNHSYTPELSFSYIPALHKSDLSPLSVREATPPYQATPYNLRERPSVLFATPEPIKTIAMLPDKPPSLIQWRDTHLPIVFGSGPERIAPDWWRGGTSGDAFSSRDYFTVQDNSGRWLWVFRDQNTQDWFVHGMWT